MTINNGQRLQEESQVEKYASYAVMSTTYARGRSRVIFCVFGVQL